MITDIPLISCGTKGTQRIIRIIAPRSSYQDFKSEISDFQPAVARTTPKRVVLASTYETCIVHMHSNTGQHNHPSLGVELMQLREPTDVPSWPFLFILLGIEPLVAITSIAQSFSSASVLSGRPPVKSYQYPLLISVTETLAGEVDSGISSQIRLEREIEYCPSLAYIVEAF